MKFVLPKTEQFKWYIFIVSVLLKCKETVGNFELVDFMYFNLKILN